MRRIKWENIVFILMVILGVVSIQHHIALNGLYFALVEEVVIYLMFAFGFRYVVKDIRKNPENWSFED